MLPVLEVYFHKNKALFSHKSKLMNQANTRSYYFYIKGLFHKNKVMCFEFLCVTNIISVILQIYYLSFKC